MGDEVCRVQTVLCQKSGHIKTKRLRFNKPLVLSGRPWLMRWSSCKLVKFPNLAPNSNSRHSHRHTQLQPCMAHRSPATLHTWHKSWKNMRRLKPIHTNPSHETCIIQKLKHEFLMLLGTPLDCSSASWLHPRCQRKEMEGRNFMSWVMSFYAVTATGNQGWTPTSLRIPRVSPKTQPP